MSKTFDVANFNVNLYDSILAQGLSAGIGEREKRVCIEAAICQVLGLPHGDDPQCVAPAVRAFKIALNDKHWSSPQARAKGLRDLGLAQLGSIDTINSAQFAKRLSEQTIRILIPTLFRELFSGNLKLLAHADRCEKEGTPTAAYVAADAAYVAAAYARAAVKRAAYANDAAYAVAAAYANDAAYSAAATNSAAHADAAAYANDAAYYSDAAPDDADKYLILSAKIALDILKEMGSPGVTLLTTGDL